VVGQVASQTLENMATNRIGQDTINFVFAILATTFALVALLH